MFVMPTLKDLVERTRRAFRTHLPGSDAWVWPNNLSPTAKVFAGLSYEVFGFIDYVAKQKFAITADSYHLDRHGEEYGLARRPAQPARGTIELSASDALTVAAGAQFRRSDGLVYRAITGGSLVAAGDIAIDVVAMVDGKASNALADTPIEIVSGVTGSALAVVGGDGIAGGDDIEGDESFRRRILFRKRYTPMSGSAADYVAWAMEVSGVTRVYVERLFAGPGTVRIFPLMDDLYANGIAPPGEIDRVSDYIASVAPAASDFLVVAPTPVYVHITISGLQPNTAAMRDIVEREIRAAFLRLSRVAGIDAAHPALPFLASPTSFSRSWLWQAIANATGEERHIITSPASDVALTPAQIAVPGPIIFT